MVKKNQRDKCAKTYILGILSSFAWISLPKINKIRKLLKIIIINENALQLLPPISSPPAPSLQHLKRERKIQPHLLTLPHISPLSLKDH
jgi:hypothetical protein